MLETVSVLFLIRRATFVAKTRFVSVFVSVQSPLFTKKCFIAVSVTIQPLSCTKMRKTRFVSVRESV